MSTNYHAGVRVECAAPQLAEREPSMLRTTGLKPTESLCRVLGETIDALGIEVFDDRFTEPLAFLGRGHAAQIGDKPASVMIRETGRELAFNVNVDVFHTQYIVLNADGPSRASIVQQSLVYRSSGRPSQESTPVSGIDVRLGSTQLQAREGDILRDLRADGFASVTEWLRRLLTTLELTVATTRTGPTWRAGHGVIAGTSSFGGLDVSLHRNSNGSLLSVTARLDRRLLSTFLLMAQPDGEVDLVSESLAWGYQRWRWESATYH